MVALSGGTQISHAAGTGANEVQAEGQIIVTARRRDETAQDVPIAMTVLGGRQLERANYQTLDQIKQLAPSLQLVATNPRNTAINIRGLGSNASVTADGLENGVGVYIDDVYYARPGQATFDLVDLDRVEILKGPQGTLFGKNTTAGAISIQTRAPSFTPEASVELSYGSLDYVQARASVSGPLMADKLAFRLTASETRRDGYIRNVRTGGDLSNLDSQLVRAQLLFTPSSSFSLRLTGDYSLRAEDCCVGLPAGLVTQLPNGTPLANAFAARATRLGYNLPSVDPARRVTDIDGTARYKVEQGGAAAQANLILDGVRLTSITSWRFWNWKPQNDADQIGLSLFARAQTTTLQRQFSQELRLASEGQRAIDYVAGLYYFYQRLPSDVITEYGSDAAAFILAPALFGNAGGAAALTGYTVTGRSTPQTHSYAAFGQATWHASPRLDVTAGLRFTQENKRGGYAQSISGGVPLSTLPALAAMIRNNFGTATAYQTQTKSGKLSGQINVAYKPSDSVLAYATYARGYKSGGLNLTNLPANASPVVGPETVDHYELGLKSRWLGNALTLNAALFRTDIGDFQATLVDVDRSISYLANAARVRSQGFELEAQARPVPFLSLFAGVTYADATYRSYSAAPCSLDRPGATICDLSGETLPNASKWSVSAGGEFDVPLGTSPLGETRLVAGADYSYRSSYGSSPDNTIYGIVPGYALTNARFGLRGDRLEFYAWARNLLNKDYVTRLNLAPFNSGLITAGAGEPRTYGVTLRATFR
ncbi:TonB-dependent receptor [Sphingobium sp. WCS2017Hpa-17]|uniref:TonB-dependent receptor n=1 Tax=Sphingobium sp. WCS2017Hpa-17 TaxID=3073638 RepID=UPI002889E32C|nr:TonB-dependent receptor [Sphingobium sp. WCS2017Hpa-17]